MLCSNLAVWLRPGNLVSTFHEFLLHSSTRIFSPPLCPLSFTCFFSELLHPLPLYYSALLQSLAVISIPPEWKCWLHVKQYGDRNEDQLQEQRPWGLQRKDVVKINKANVDRKNREWGERQGLENKLMWNWNLNYLLEFWCRQKHTCFVNETQKQREAVGMFEIVTERGGSVVKHLHVCRHVAAITNSGLTHCPFLFSHSPFLLLYTARISNAFCHLQDCKSPSRCFAQFHTIYVSAEGSSSCCGILLNHRWRHWDKILHISAKPKTKKSQIFFILFQKVSLCKIAESQCFCCYHSRCNVRGHKNLNREVHSNNLHQQIWCHFIVQLCSKNGEDNGSTDGLHDHLRQLECSLASFW